MAVCDHNYKFISCNIGGAGRQSDGGVFRNSGFGKKLYNNKLSLPTPKNINNKFMDMPYIFVADDAFSLHEKMLKPFGHTCLTTTEKIFNYRLSRARRIIENVFGILTAQWRIFRAPINESPKRTENIISACVCLHNYLQNQKENANADIDSAWHQPPNNFLSLNRTTSNSSKKAKEVRNKYAEYFVTDGAVSWQTDKI